MGCAMRWIRSCGSVDGVVTLAATVGLLRLQAGFTTETVESRRGAVSFARPVSPPRSSNRTCGFPASGFPTGFMVDSRHDALPPAMAQSWHTERAKHGRHRERSDASRGHLVASHEEVADAVIDMRLD